MKRFALSASGADRPGILAAVTKAVFERGLSIEDSAMTVIDGELSLLLIVSGKEGFDERAFHKDIQNIQQSTGVSMLLREIAARGALRKKQQSNYIITLHGPDRAGIVYRTAEFLTSMGANITDLEVRTLSSGRGRPAYIMIIEVYSPVRSDIKKLEEGLASIGAGLGASISIRPLEAFEPL